MILHTNSFKQLYNVMNLAHRKIPLALSLYSRFN